MKFGRYASYVRDVFVTLGIVSSVIMVVAVDYALKKENIILILMCAGIILFFNFIFYVIADFEIKNVGGRMNDYIIFNKDNAELHSGERIVSISWAEAREIQEVILGRGMRQIKIFAKDGTMISFASDGGREKIIWEMHPELKEKYRRRCNH